MAQAGLYLGDELSVIAVAFIALHASVLAGTNVDVDYSQAQQWQD